MELHNLLAALDRKANIIAAITKNPNSLIQITANQVPYITVLPSEFIYPMIIKTLELERTRCLTRMEEIRQKLELTHDDVQRIRNESSAANASESSGISGDEPTAQGSQREIPNLLHGAENPGGESEVPQDDN